MAIVLAATLLRATLLEPMRVYSRSMEPTYSEGDWLLVRRMKTENAPLLRTSSAREGTIVSRGDVVVFGTTSFVMAAFPDDTVAVKRIAAIEGDTVEAKLGTILVNGKKYEGVQSSSAISSGTSQSSEPNSSERSDDWKPEWARLRSLTATRHVIPVGHVFVLGDNLTSSVDSRRFGAIPASTIKGRVLFAHFKRRWIGL